MSAKYVNISVKIYSVFYMCVYIYIHTHYITVYLHIHTHTHYCCCQMSWEGSLEEVLITKSNPQTFKNQMFSAEEDTSKLVVLRRILHIWLEQSDLQPSDREHSGSLHIAQFAWHIIISQTLIRQGQMNHSSNIHSYCRERML